MYDTYLLNNIKAKMQMVIKVSIKDSINLLLAFETGLSHDETF